jgi:hypothetical protein
MSDTQPPKLRLWEERMKALAQEAFNRAKERQEREAALAEQRTGLRAAIRSIDERLKIIGIPTQDRSLVEERETLLKHRGELRQELEELEGRSSPSREHDRSLDR